MKVRPILFSAPMVRAILGGGKTQTRRIAKNVIDVHTRTGEPLAGIDSAGPRVPCPYGQVGDRLWVRESFWIEHDSDSHEGSGAFDCGIDLKTGDWASVCYCADQDAAGTWIGPDQYYHERTFVPWGEEGFLVPEFFSKRPNIHMPRWACRILLQVTGVRVERLQDISQADAYAEGAMSWAQEQEPPIKDLNGGDDRIAFMALWESIEGAGSWDANPWVWVIEFRRIEA
ncbi:hypothetical protein [Herbaspirillum aquaticum]|uniref:Morphogenetic protein n=1 Tax=Herbaspirillum aquaticum TaxID=568783 RepID=A0A225SN54_9BURK|nr:hypothetical protein [Herbaspirillum aquaticum]OWY32493.1 hypothetical protein CEJ45_20800 [Herbaspirillum aquaticum]